jgi:hypothetical protein
MPIPTGVSAGVIPHLAVYTFTNFEAGLSNALSNTVSSLNGFIRMNDNGTFSFNTPVVSDVNRYVLKSKTILINFPTVMVLNNHAHGDFASLDVSLVDFKALSVILSALFIGKWVGQGGGAGSAISDVTYSLRAYDTVSQDFVYWASFGVPELSPTLTYPTATGVTTALGVVGIVEP